MENLVFVPGYHNGAAPDGFFEGRISTAFAGWTEDSNLHWDVGMLIVHSNGLGERLVDAVGGNGLTINAGRANNVHVLGYPTNFDNGEFQRVCRGNTERVSILDGRVQVRCYFEGGGSGSPWMLDYDVDNDTLGYANGVHSTHRTDGSGWNVSPYFGNSVGDMYDDIKNG